MATTTKEKRIDPVTGKPVSPPTVAGVPQIYSGGSAIGDVPSGFSNMTQAEQEAWILENYGEDVSGQQWGYAGGTMPPNTTSTSAGGCGGGCGGISGSNIPAPVVTPAPPFVISPEQQAWQDEISEQIGAWVGAGGYGIPEETQKLMIQQESETLKAKEKEDIRVMRNNMERRGITNSGFVYSNEQNIRSNTTLALARSINNIQIQSALMKMASFEKAMGAASQFLGYLGEMSALKYQPEFATWQAEQQAKLYQYQAQMDLYKLKLQQCYNQQNLILAGNIAAQAAAQQHQWDTEIAQMEIEAANQQAMYSGVGGILSWIVGS